MLRNPIDRAYSQFNVSVREGTEELSFDNAVFEEMDRLQIEISNKDDNIIKFPNNQRNYIKKGLYAMQLKAWFNIFPRENILVLSTEDFKKNDNLIYKEIFRFLDIPEIEIKNKEHMQKGEYSSMTQTSRKKLGDFYQKHNNELYELIGKKFDWAE